jgi:hypothetical protein
MGYTDYPLDHVTPEGVKELGHAINQFILWNRCEIFLDGLTSPQRQRIQLSQTPMSSPADHALATPPSQQAAQKLPSPHTEIEAQQLQSPKQQATQQRPLQSPPKDKEASQLPSPPTETEAPKDKEASPI